MAAVNGPSDGNQAAPDATAARRILALLRDDDVDAAIDAGLAAFRPLDGLDAADNAALAAARDRLLAAWAARERFRARSLRLDRIAGERKRARTTPAAAAKRPAPGDDAAAAATPPPLPPAAAAALARARARAAVRQP